MPMDIIDSPHRQLHCSELHSASGQYLSHHQPQTMVCRQKESTERSHAKVHLGPTL